MSRVLPLLDFIPRLSPNLEPPHHLKRLTDVFERIGRGDSVRVVVDVPPRHGKTETLMHGIAWLLLQDPTLQAAYASYAGRLSEKKSRKVRELARRAGVPLAKDAKGRQDWRTGVDDGGLWATSVDGPITGEGFHLVVLDDLIRGRAAAESAAVRERTHAWITSDVLTRVEPGGSMIVNATRWHTDDPSARLIASGWEHISLRAIDDSGKALWPDRWPIAELLKIRDSLGGEGSYEWEALYQGRPRGHGQRVFNDAHVYEQRPEKLRVIIGCDFAFSTKSYADWSVAVVLGTDGKRFCNRFRLRTHVQIRIVARTGARRLAIAHASPVSPATAVETGASPINPANGERASSVQCPPASSRIIASRKPRRTQSTSSGSSYGPVVSPFVLTYHFIRRQRPMTAESAVTVKEQRRSPENDGV